MAAHVGRASMLPEVAPALRQMTRAGMSAATISERLGVNPRTVVRWRSALGISRPTPGPITPEERARALTLLSDGASYNEVARTIGRCASAIARALPGRGWTQLESSQFGAFVSKTNMRERGVL